MIENAEPSRKLKREYIESLTNILLKQGQDFLEWMSSRKENWCKKSINEEKKSLVDEVRETVYQIIDPTERKSRRETQESRNLEGGTGERKRDRTNI